MSILGATIAEAYQHGYDSAELNRLDMEIGYLKHIEDMLGSSDNVSQVIMDSLARRIGMLYTQYNDLKQLTENKAV